MKRAWPLTKTYLPLVLLFLVVWLIMIELFNWIAVVAGIAVAIAAIVFTNAVLRIDYAAISLRPWAALRYLGVLLREMVLAAGTMIVIIVSGPDRDTEFEHVSGLAGDQALFLLANTIILTPGSVAVERDGNVITVITADPNLDRARAGVERFERAIARLNLSSPKPEGGDA